MASEFHFDSDVWPTLPTSKDSAPVAERSDDWEILEDSNEIDDRPTESKESTIGVPREVADFIVVNESSGETNPRDEEQSRPNKKVLRHSLSSPILTGNSSKDIRVASSDVASPPGVAGRDELDDGFTLLSDVASVWTTTSTVASARTVSFRDAILLSPNAALSLQKSNRLQAASTTRISPETSRQRSRVQPRFVVVQSPPDHIRRCSKSTGNLLEMSAAPFLENEDSVSTGFADSDHDRCFDEEFYFRKALGSASRVNGLRLRPDEAKRRLMILNKKDQQRLAASKGRS
jgi:hypothetical protein